MFRICNNMSMQFICEIVRQTILCNQSCCHLQTSPTFPHPSHAVLQASPSLLAMTKCPGPITEGAQLIYDRKIQQIACNPLKGSFRSQTSSHDFIPPFIFLFEKMHLFVS